MTSKRDVNTVSGHIKWSVIGLMMALLVAYASSEWQSADSGVMEAGISVQGSDVSSTSFAPFGKLRASPAAAPSPKRGVVIPDTIDGVLVWPDPWDRIVRIDPVFH